MAGFTIAPSCAAALREATRRWPHRNRASDGTIGDPAHSNRTSDHNPAPDGYVYAFDLTHDPAHGCDAHALIRAAVARRDPRIKYAISQGRIWTASRASEGWRAYTGSNPHTRHAHISIVPARRDDTAPWWAGVKAHTAVKPQPLQEDVMASLEEVRAVVRDEINRLSGGPRRRDQDGDVVDSDPQTISVADTYTLLEQVQDEIRALRAEVSK